MGQTGLRSAELNMNQSAGPSRKFMKWRMMLWNAKLRLKKNVRKKLLDTQAVLSSLSGPRKFCSVSKKPVKKFTPVTGCTKEPRELCAPAGCGFKQGAPICYDKTQTIVQDAPKEDCTRSRTNPRKVKKPVVKKWCYIPSEESG